MLEIKGEKEIAINHHLLLHFAKILSIKSHLSCWPNRNVTKAMNLDIFLLRQSLIIEPTTKQLLAIISVLFAFSAAFFYVPQSKSICKFIYNCFLKPYNLGSTHDQQSALESFYAGQADIYDATRSLLLRGREEMLAMASGRIVMTKRSRLIWVDVSFSKALMLTRWKLDDELMELHRLVVVLAGTLNK